MLSQTASCCLLIKLNLRNKQLFETDKGNCALRIAVSRNLLTSCRNPKPHIFVFLPAQVSTPYLRMPRTRFFLLLLFTVVQLTTVAQTTPAFLQPNPRIDRWVDSVFTTLTPDERIGQLIMVAGYSNRTPAY